MYLKTLARCKFIFNEFFRVLVIPTSHGLLLVEFLRPIVRIRGLKSAKSTLKLNIDGTLTNKVTVAINGDKLLDVKRTARHADGIERADLLREVFANRLILVADYVGRFDAEAYCGAVETPRYFAFSGDFDT